MTKFLRNFTALQRGEKSNPNPSEAIVKELTEDVIVINPDSQDYLH